MTGPAKIGHICTQNLALFLNFNLQYLLQYEGYDNKIFIPYSQMSRAVIIIFYIRPTFVNTLFPVTRPHHIYSTALVIIIVIDNLKYIVIFKYIGFLLWKIPEVSENASRCPSKQNLR